ncbi:hypothetical protein FACS1894181_17730 [Bacteroidia bacterium]|nr:hypothetical protein FACS1894181_17730 [Bacteroidia bacterium]
MKIQFILRIVLRPVTNIFRKMQIKKKYREKEDQKDDIASITIFMVNGLIKHGGLVDRLKGIVSAYAVCKNNNIPFKIKFDFPFQLSSYLEPNKYNWKLESEVLVSYNTKKISLIMAMNDEKSKQLFKYIFRNEQIGAKRNNIIFIVIWI